MMRVDVGVCDLGVCDLGVCEGVCEFPTMYTCATVPAAAPTFLGVPVRPEPLFATDPDRTGTSACARGNGFAFDSTLGIPEFPEPFFTTGTETGV
jgi:hypothetical protein